MRDGGTVAPLPPSPPCACKVRCTDVPEDEDHPFAACKGLPMPDREPLVILELVDRRAE